MKWGSLQSHSEKQQSGNTPWGSFATGRHSSSQLIAQHLREKEKWAYHKIIYSKWYSNYKTTGILTPLRWILQIWDYIESSHTVAFPSLTTRHLQGTLSCSPELWHCIYLSDTNSEDEIISPPSEWTDLYCRKIIHQWFKHRPSTMATLPLNIDASIELSNSAASAQRTTQEPLEECCISGCSTSTKTALYSLVVSKDCDRLIQTMIASTVAEIFLPSRQSVL